MPSSQPSNTPHRRVNDTQESASSTASSTSSSSSSPSSTNISNSSYATDPRMQVLSPSHMRPTIEQQERQKRQQQQQQQQQQRQQPLRSATKDVPVEDYDQESKAGRERLLAEYDTERAEKRDRMLRRKLDKGLNNVFNAYPHILQIMAEIDPTMTEVSINLTITTVSRTGTNDKSTNKLSVTTTSTSSTSAQDSRADLSSSVAGPITFKNNGNTLSKSPADPAVRPRVNPVHLASGHHSVATGLSAAAHVMVPSTPLEGEMIISASPPVASLSSLFSRSLEEGTEALPQRKVSGAKRVRKQRFRQIDEYVLGGHLGKGTFAKVRKCKSIVDQKEYAMRIIPIEHHDVPIEKEEAVAKEVAIMKKLQHPHIIEFKDFFHEEKEGKWYMVVELCEGELVKVGDDCQAEKPFTEDECRSYFHQLLLGMEYLHEHNIIHKDIKPANLLISRDGTLKIADFGISEEFRSADDMTIKTRGPGTPEYMAPELFTRGGVNGRPTDIWSMGVTLFLMWNGKIPFQVQKVVKIPVFQRAEIKNGTSEPLKALLNKLLELDPTKRITMDKLREDPWVTDNGRKPLVKSKKDNVGVEINVTEEDVKTAIKSISVLFAVAKAARMFKSTLSRTRGANLAAMMQEMPSDVTNMIVNGEGTAVMTDDVEFDTDVEDGTDVGHGTSGHGDTSEDEDESRFRTCQGYTQLQQ